MATLKMTQFSTMFLLNIGLFEKQASTTVRQMLDRKK
tara:strand:+ start:419 stop:529 length:111 start_codon:yes stop_codon:yes gene_type:complete